MSHPPVHGNASVHSLKETLVYRRPSVLDRHSKGNIMKLTTLSLTTLSLATLLACGTASAVPSAPTAVLTEGSSFVEYTGPGPVGNNNINTDRKLYWFYESQGTYGGQSVDSWFVFFDPSKSSQLKGVVSFNSKIVALQDTQSELVATGAFGKSGVTYNYTNRLVGLESNDREVTSFAGSKLTFDWSASNPGDHVRVMTLAVPEPETYALMAAGLAAVGFVARRRKQT